MDARVEAGAIVAHYLKALAQRAGLRWTPANDADMRRLADLLADNASDTIPPYMPEQPRQLDTRVTTVLERERARADALDDPQYRQWRQQHDAVGGAERQRR